MTPDLNIFAHEGWLTEWAGAALFGSLAVALALLLHAALYRVLLRLARGSSIDSDELVVAKIGRPLRWALVAVAIAYTAQEVPALAAIWARISGVVVPAIAGWFMIAILKAFAGVAQVRTGLRSADQLTARRRQTRIGILSRLATFVVVMITIALMLLSIPGVRSVGLTLIASAGLAGLAVGAAAQPALRSLIAGIQMALTEPIHIEDVVIVEGRWGWVEEIRTTYVILRSWDQRRFVVPVTKFLEDSFESWSWPDEKLFGSVFLYVDPATDVAPLREELQRLVRSNKRWNGKRADIMVTDTQPGSMEVRAVVSASDAITLFDLRCDVREGLMDFIRRDMPEAILRHRVERQLAPGLSPADPSASAD